MTILALIGAAVSFAAWVFLVNRWWIARVPEFISKIPRSSLSVFLAFAIVATGVAQKGGTNAPPNGVSPPQMMGLLPQGFPPLNLTGDGGVVSVTSSDVARGFLLESVVTNDSYSYAMPTNGTRYVRWWNRGGHEDVFRLDLDGMVFPLGTNLCSSLWVYTWGMAGVRLADASNSIAATGVPMSAVPFASQFWSAALPDGARRLTWQDFALNRDTNTPVSAQLDLYPSGDFVARSNLVETVYRRVNPDDWDDDGYPNDMDPNPYAFDEGCFGPHQELPQGANPNAYCWVDIVVSNANALVTFVGDGPSALPDPSFIARAGETNRVTVLIGKTYTVMCNMPISCVDKSGFDIDVWQNSPTELHICWPVTIEAVGMRSGASFSMSVWPDCLGGSFVWTNSCCSISSSGGVFMYSCNDACHCTGCAAMGYYGYESYRLPAYGGWCGCSSYGEHDERPCEEDDEGPYDAGAAAVFSESVVIFEDAYTNSPGNCVGRQSTQTELHCVAHGGPNGGHVRFEIVGEDKLERVSGHVLPVEQDVGPGKKIDFTIVYKGRLPSTAAEDIIVTTTFTENVPNATQEQDEERLTSVKALIVSSCLIEDVPNRHCFGFRENFIVEIVPSGVNETISRGFGWDLDFVIGVPVYSCPMNVDGNGITIHVGNATYIPQLSVVKPQGVICSSGRSACGYGVVAMQLEPYIVPQYVSFSNIKMMEVPSMAGGPSGYFTNTIFEAYWHHTTNRSAGVWYRPRADNFFFEDVPSFGLYCPPPLTDGTITWVIPIGWGENDASSLEDVVGTMSTLYNQVYTLDEDGGLRIDKFGQWIKMDVLGDITHSPGISEQ